MHEMKQKSILICEAGEVLLSALEFRLKKNGYLTRMAKDGRIARDMMEEKMPDLLIADLDAHPVSAVDLLRFMRHDLGFETPLIMLADLEKDDRILEAFSLGVTDFVAKPFNPNELILRIRRVFHENEPSNNN